MIISIADFEKKLKEGTFDFSSGWYRSIPQNYFNVFKDIFADSILFFLITTRFKYKQLEEVLENLEEPLSYGQTVGSVFRYYIFNIIERNNNPMAITHDDPKSLLKLMNALTAVNETQLADIFAQKYHQEWKKYHKYWMEPEIYRELSIRIKLYESKETASVIEPYELIREEFIPEFYKKLWFVTSRAIDPFVGYGQIIKALKDYLLNIGFDERVILEDMLYFNDFDLFKLLITEAIIDPDNQYMLNSLCIDVEEHKKFHFFNSSKYKTNSGRKRGKISYDKKWKKYLQKWKNLMKKFDFVATNTPFTLIDGTGSVGGSKGNNTFYRPCCELLFDLLNDKFESRIVAISAVGAMRSIQKVGRSFHVLSKLTHKKYWEYRSSFFVANNVSSLAQPIIRDSVTQKSFAYLKTDDDKTWKKHYRYVQSATNLVNVHKSDGSGRYAVISKLPGKKNKKLEWTTTDIKLVPEDFEWKFCVALLLGRSPGSHTVTKDPCVAADSVCLYTGKSEENAKKMQMFRENSDLITVIIDEGNIKYNSNIYKYMYYFDIGKISWADLKTGRAFPEEHDYTQKEKDIISLQADTIRQKSGKKKKKK